EVAANRSAVTSPVTATSSLSGSVSQLSTSGRRWTKRWSSVSQTGQPGPGYVGSIGRWRYGTGCAGSQTYSSEQGALAAGGTTDHGPAAWNDRVRLVTVRWGGQWAC